MPIALLLSADLYNGAPVADITLDGVALPSVPVTVPHGQPSQRVVLAAAPGPHTLVVGFANDAWGGTADTDRNLYLDGIEGVTETVAPHAFLRPETITLTLTVPDDGLAMLTRLDAVLTEAAVLSQKMRGLMAHRSDVPMPVLTTTSGVYRPGAAIVLTTTAAASPVAALPAITVSPSAPTFAVGASGVFAVLSVVPSGAARTISGDGRVVLGAAGGTLVVGMTAATAGTSVPVTITDAMAGTVSVTLVLSILVTAATAIPAGNPVLNPNADGFGLGIFGPTNLTVSANGNNESRAGSWFARLATPGAQIWTLTGTVTQGMYLRPPGATLGYYGGPPVGTYTGVLTCTDGVSTASLNITVVVQAGGMLDGANFMLNTSPKWTYGSVLNDRIPLPGHMMWPYGTGYNSFPVTFSDANNLMQIDGDGFSGLASTSAAAPLSSHYGHYVGAQFFTNNITYPYEYWIAQEQPAGITITHAQSYDYAVQGDIFGNVTATSDAGVATFAIVASDDRFNLGSTGIITHAAPPIAGANKSLTVRITSNNGITTDRVYAYSVGVGNVLPSSAMLLPISQTLTNGSKNQTVGTASITGRTGGVWTLKNQDTFNYPTYSTGPMRLLSVDQTGRVFAPDLLAARADGHTMQITWTSGADICRASFTAPCSWFPGPTYYVGRGMVAAHGANGFEHLRDVLGMFINNGNGISAAAIGCTVKIAYDSDPDYYANDNGSATATLPQDASMRYGLNGPVRFEAMDKTGPRPRLGGYVNSPSSGSDPGGKGFFNLLGGDFVLDHLEISWVNGYGSPTTDNSHGISGVRVNADTWGDFAAYDCVFSNCNNGLEAGEGPKRLTIDRCVDFNNGTGTVSAGHTHGYYLDGMEVIFTNNLVYKIAIGHMLKSRAYRGTIRGNRFYDGLRGTASEPINIPQGGTYLVENNDFHKGPNPQNPFMIGYLEDDYGRDRVDVLTVRNNRFSFMVPASMNSTPGWAVVHFGKLSTLDGAQSQVLMDGNSYYAPSGAQHFYMWNHAPGHTLTYTETNPIALTSSFALNFTDPGVSPVARPGFFNFTFDDEGGNSMPNSYCVQQDPGIEMVQLMASAPVGTVVLPRITGYGANLFKNDSLTSPRINPFVAGTTWALSQDTTSYGGSGFAPVGRYLIAASTDGTSAVVTTGTVLPATNDVDYIKVRATAPDGTIGDWRYCIPRVLA